VGADGPAGALGAPGAVPGVVPLSAGVLVAAPPGVVVVRPVVERLPAPEEGDGPGEPDGAGVPEVCSEVCCEVCCEVCSGAVVRAGRLVVRAGVVTEVSLPAAEVGVGGATKVHST
jgi:hypothetical protein